ncbi:MAG: pseudoazurin [Pseudomonadota bacterium]
MPTQTLNRRTFLIATGAAATSTAVAAQTCIGTSEGTQHTVLMLNASCGDGGDGGVPNVFSPAILHVQPGDTVQFLATDTGHNTASRRGMIPDGAEAWNGGVDEELTVEFTVPGVYGYVCAPHYDVGMVGLIVVGDDLSNLDQAKSVRHSGEARTAFRVLFAELEETDAT